MNISKIFSEELKLYAHDRWLQASVSVLPLVLFFLLLNVFNTNAIENIPIGVVDFDNSSISRQFIRNCNSNKAIKISKIYQNEPQAFKDLKRSKIYALLVIPKNMKKNYIKGISTNISLSYNTQFIAVGKSIKASISTSLAYYNAYLIAGKSLYKKDTNLILAKAQALPFNQQITPIYNLGLDYAKFLLSLILPCIWQIIIVSSMTLNLCTLETNGKLFSFLQEQTLLKSLAKIVIHSVFMMILFLTFIGYFYGYLAWDFKGSFSFLVLAGFLNILASQSMAFLFYFTSFDRARAISTAAAFSAPSLAFIGITFPYTDMSFFAQIWSNLLPISHYINIQISQANYGSNISFDMKYIFNLFIFIALFSLSALCIRVVKKRRMFEHI